MLKDRSLVYFAPERWDGLWRNRQQLMSIFARQNKVLFVDPRMHLRPTISAIKRGGLAMPELRHPRIRHIANNLHVFRYPAWAPISGRDPLQHLTHNIRQKSLSQVLDELQMSDPIVWFSRPTMGDLLDEIPTPSMVIYHVVDEYTAYGGVSAAERKHLEDLEQKLMVRSDAVVVVSQNLFDAKSPHNTETHLVPNGVNFDAYSAALDDSHMPSELQAIPSPRLGYSGLVGDRLNFSLLKAMAEAHPEWSLVFLGESRVNEQAETWQALSRMPNVHYLGLVDVAQVPYYLKGFDVGLMPYAQTREADNISPLKLYDYLAAGIPVASMDIPAARNFADYIHISDKPEDFDDAVKLALASTGNDASRVRRNIAKQHTWEARVEQLSDIIQKQLTPLPV